MCTSEDEYDAQLGGAIEISEEDGVRLDAQCARALMQTEPCRGPVTYINVALETSQEPIPARMQKLNINLVSPFERYRQKGRLSVTDLVAPTWCEFQFEYGLRQHRSRRLDKRPESFITRDGKEIRVQKKRAELNDAVLREGHAIHTALEREIHPTQVTVQVETPEEEWGLRFINMLSDIQTLLLIGKCREFPVVGFIHNHLIVGIIDEVIREPLSEAQLKSESSKRPPDDSFPKTPRKHTSKRSNGAETLLSEKQLNISSFFPTTPKKLERFPALNDHEKKPSHGIDKGEAGSPKLPESVTRTHTLYLIDSKTRMSASLPQHSATLSSRLQLMVYKRLLDALLSTTPLFDFDDLWIHIGADPCRRFSDTFLAKAPHTSEIKCLKDLECKWRAAVQDLGVSGREGQDKTKSSSPVHDQLTLVYRLRASGQGEQRQGRTRTQLNLSSEDGDLQRAPKESLPSAPTPKDKHVDTRPNTSKEQEPCISGPGNLGGLSTSVECSETLDESSPRDALDPQLDWAIRESLREAAKPPQITSHVAIDTDLQASSQSRSTSPLQSGNIIGRKQFTHDDAMLDAHLTNVLQWWHGEREPCGVAVEDSNRCYTCEYMSGCEWRERKALEEIEARKARMKDP